MSVNKVILIGRLGKDAELKYSPDGKARLSFTVATDYGSGDRKQTEWANCLLWGDHAERMAQYMTKGKQVFVEGRMQTRNWEADGQKHYRTEVIANSVQLLDKRDGGEKPYARGGDVDIDDLPFE